MAKRTQKTNAPVAAPAPDGGLTEYTVTEKAPGRVAGKQAVVGKTIGLTEEQARAELLAGHVRPAGMPERVKKDAPSTPE